MSKATESVGHMGGRRYSHPAMVTVQFNRIEHGFGGVSLFGSSVKHRSSVILRISKADVERDLSTDWVHGGIDPIIEVELAPAQFSELLVSMNVGTGVPATLRYHNGESFDSPELPTKAEEFRSEIESALTKAMDGIRSAQTEVNGLLNDDKPIGKKGKLELQEMLRRLNGLAEGTIPFIMEQFSKQMSKTVVEAKAEVDAFVTHAIQQTGLKALREAAPNIEIEGPEEDL
jgi:hypothetical protein